MKRNRFEIAPQALLLAAGVILSVVLISIMVMQFEQARKMSDVVSGKMIEDTERLRNSGIMQYDGLRVSGAEVRNFYKLYLTATGPKGFEKLIVKNSGAEKSYTRSGNFSELTDTSAGSYVAPTDIYLCTVEQNANGIITNVIFNLEK